MKLLMSELCFLLPMFFKGNQQKILIEGEQKRCVRALVLTCTHESVNNLR